MYLTFCKSQYNKNNLRAIKNVFLKKTMEILKSESEKWMDYRNGRHFKEYPIW